ncbi:MAG: hypothetical protein ACI8UO_002017 [Verrucomicrobiales bacterium]|jgi:hypothetical protein
MQFSERFKTLTLEELGFGELPADEPDFYTRLVAYDQVAGIEAKTTESGEIVALNGNLTTPEVRETLSTGIHGATQRLVAQSGIPFNDRDPEKEHRHMAWFLQRLGAPFGPEAEVSEVHAFLDAFCPSLLSTKPWTNDQTTGRRFLAVASDAIMIEGFFHNEHLYDFEVTDLRMRIQADPFDDTPKAVVERERSEALAALENDPRPAAFRYGQWHSDLEVEWHKNLDPPALPEKHVDVIEDSMAENPGQIPVSREPKKKGLFSALRSRGKADDLDEAMQQGQIMQRQQAMVAKYGSLADMLGQIPESDVFNDTANWFLWPEEKEDVANLSLGRMAAVLRWLHDDLAEGNGVQGWLEFHLNDDEHNDSAEAMAALQLVGGNEIFSLFCQLANQARAAGFDPSSSESWEAYFEDHETDQEDACAYEHAQKLPAQFIQYVKAHPELVKSGEERVAEITARRPLEFVDGQEMMAGMTGMLGAMMKPMMGLMNKSLNRLSEVDGMEDLDLSEYDGLDLDVDKLNPELAAAQKDLFRREREEALSKYGTISGVVQNAPAESLLHLVAAAGGYNEKDQFRPDQVPEVSRMAGELNEWVIHAETGMDFWLEGSSNDEVTRALANLQAIQSPVVETLGRAFAEAQKAGAGQDPIFDWLDFLEERSDLWPTDDDAEEFFEPFIAAVPELFRSYWKGRLVEDTALAF